VISEIARPRGDEGDFGRIWIHWYCSFTCSASLEVLRIGTSNREIPPIISIPGVLADVNCSTGVQKNTILVREIILEILIVLDLLESLDFHNRLAEYRGVIQKAADICCEPSIPSIIRSYISPDTEPSGLLLQHPLLVLNCNKITSSNHSEYQHHLRSLRIFSSIEPTLPHIL
jgi:hypothetical protein